MVTPLATLLLLALAATPPASPLETPPRPLPGTPGFATVLQATGARAYLDAGSDDGLGLGQVLSMRRGELAVATCTVEAVSTSHATCAGTGIRPGDVAKLSTHTSDERRPVTLPPVPGDDELAHRAAQAAAAPVALVEAKAKPAGTNPLESPRTGFGEFTFSDVSWWSSGQGAYHVERVDAVLHGAPVGPFTADVDLRAEYVTTQPATARFLPNEKARFLLWQAQLTWASESRPITISAGRVLAWNVPGATSMDGVQLSWRRGGFTAGLLGGLIPQPDTTAPTSTRATAGGFWGWEGKLANRVVVRQEGRLALVRTPELGNRVELQTGGSAHAGSWFDVFGDLRLGYGGKVQSAGGLDGARLEGAVRPMARLSLMGSFDYGQLLVPQPFTPLAWAGRSRHAEANLSWDFGWVRAGLSGGGARDLGAGMEHAWVGPELQVPRFFTPRVALSVAYQEDVGWLKGRGAWLQAVARPWDPLRLIARINWASQTNLGMDQDEVGLYLSGSADLTRHLGLRLSTLVRASIGSRNDTPLGFNVLLSAYSLY
jgi:hypothetical protein